ncbi:MAG: hypothetical protein ACLS5H_06250 [Streptococcus salivarius]
MLIKAEENYQKLNQHGKRTIALTGDDAINYRKELQLEDKPIYLDR